MFVFFSFLVLFSSRRLVTAAWNHTSKKLSLWFFDGYGPCARFLKRLISRSDNRFEESIIPGIDLEGWTGYHWADFVLDGDHLQ